MEVLTSRQNPLCSEIRKLRAQRKYRYQRRLFLADGVKLVGEALQNHASVERLVLQEGICLPFDIPNEIPVTLVSKELMDYISVMDCPQGILAICRMPEPVPLELMPGTLILSDLQDPGNLGTILRTADALDVPVILADGCADPYSEKTVRSSMGAVFRRKPLLSGNAELISLCKKAGIPLAVTRLSPDSMDIRKAELSSYALIIGNEGHGVSKDFLDAADVSLIIPMNPHCESLNAASAATIVLWQLYLNRG